MEPGASPAGAGNSCAAGIEEGVEEDRAAAPRGPLVEPGEPLQVDGAGPERAVGGRVRVGRQPEADEPRLHLVEGEPDLGPRRPVREVGVDRRVERVAGVARVKAARAEVIEPVEADPEVERVRQRRLGRAEPEREVLLRRVVDRVAARDWLDAAGLGGLAPTRKGDEPRPGGERVEQAAAGGHRDLRGARDQGVIVKGASLVSLARHGEGTPRAVGVPGTQRLTRQEPPGVDGTVQE